MSSLQDGDYSDPTGDRLILEEFKRLDMVPADADGNSAQHWGHTEAGDEFDGRLESHPEIYGRLTTQQYEAANRRYLAYHDRAIRHGLTRHRSAASYTATLPNAASWAHPYRLSARRG